MKTFTILLTSFCALCACAASAQDNRIAVPFSDPSRPGRVVANTIQGCFTVEGYDGKEVLIEQGRGGPGERQRPVPRNAEGLKRIEPASKGLNVEESDNTIKIHSMMAHERDMLIRVPFGTSLKLECMNGGDIKVEHVTGDIELQNLNGAVTAIGVSGSVIAHSLNGRVIVTMDKVTADKPMSFSSLNGDVDVTFPADTRANVRMKTDNGEIFSDFDIKVNPNAQAPVVEDGRAKGGKYRVKVDSTTVGALNGGGPDMTFKTFNGNIFIRKKK
jgi:hypothetical protein